MDIFLSVLIVRRFFFAARKAFSTATGVSAALPCPTPTTPLRLPATSVTEKLKRRPPATTRVTRLTETVLWSNSGLTLVSFLGLLLGFFLNSRPILPLGAFFSPPAGKTASGALFFVSSAGVFVSVCFSSLSIFRNLTRRLLRRRREPLSCLCKCIRFCQKPRLLLFLPAPFSRESFQAPPPCRLPSFP